MPSSNRLTCYRPKGVLFKTIFRIYVNIMADHSQMGICQRIAKIRMEVAGPRGKSTFAKRLGISPSTYDYYESRRVPPADLLVRISDIAGVDLRWLLTGEASADPAVPAAHPVLQRAAAMLARRPESAKPLGAFLDVLAESLKFPAKAGAARTSEEGSAATSTAAAHAGSQTVLAPDPPPPDPEAARPPTAQDVAPPSDVAAALPQGWIPILGRSAAGVPQFWREGEEAVGVRTLEELVARHVGRRPARADAASASFSAAAGDAGPLRDLPVQIVRLDGPAESGVAEYVASPEMKARHADAFAVRIDGESMSPEIRHGDLVVLSPSAPAEEGRAAVVQLRRQIGVTCKLFRRQGARVHLVPVNEHFAPSAYAAGRVVWALRVLATVRPAGSAGP